ncbi:MAG: SIS domain-containing protein, partial [Patescibacteria group bacterium]
AMKKVKLPLSYKKIDKIVLFGMGGSALGIDVARALYGNEINIPIEIVNDYQVPKYLTKDSLVILSSYSGSTEETVGAAREVAKITKKIFVITTGKDLLNLAKRKKYPVYKIDPKFNPCDQPRVAVGYSITCQFALLSKLGLIKLSDKEFKGLVDFLKKNAKKFEKDAIKAAEKSKGKVIVWVAAEFLKGNAHILSNQTNETGKQFAVWFPVPEMNHHLMEGFSYPQSFSKSAMFIFINSNLYFKRNQLRMKLTQEVAKKNKAATAMMKFTSENKLRQVMALLSWGGYYSFYLAMVNKVDPSLIPWVDYFKKQLGKRK